MFFSTHGDFSDNLVPESTWLAEELKLRWGGMKIPGQDYMLVFGGCKFKYHQMRKTLMLSPFVAPVVVLTPPSCRVLQGLPGAQGPEAGPVRL